MIFGIVIKRIELSRKYVFINFKRYFRISNILGTNESESAHNSVVHNPSVIRLRLFTCALAVFSCFVSGFSTFPICYKTNSRTTQKRTPKATVGT